MKPLTTIVTMLVLAAATACQNRAPGREDDK